MIQAQRLMEWTHDDWKNCQESCVTKWQYFLLLDFIVNNNQVMCKRNIFPCPSEENCAHVFYNEEKNKCKDTYFKDRLHLYTAFANEQRKFYINCYINVSCINKEDKDSSEVLLLKPDDLFWTCKFMAAHGHCIYNSLIKKVPQHVAIP
jgi:hypothetical protein